MMGLDMSNGGYWGGRGAMSSRAKNGPNALKYGQKACFADVTSTVAETGVDSLTAMIKIFWKAYSMPSDACKMHSMSRRLGTTSGGRMWMNIYMLTTLALLALAQEASGAVSENAVRLQCGTARDVTVTDYRLKDTTSALQWAIEDVKQNHLDPAVQSLNDGNFSSAVLSDISFILNHWPNHYPALQALIRYEVGGGKEVPYYPIDCYFEAARQFVPDDANVLVLYGLYRYKSGDNDHAEMYWRQALQVESNSADAHYNLGLLYVEQGRYNDALEHAVKAYSLGYPLPGLKNELIRAGYWEQQSEH